MGGHLIVGDLMCRNILHMAETIKFLGGLPLVTLAIYFFNDKGWDFRISKLGGFFLLAFLDLHLMVRFALCIRNIDKVMPVWVNCFVCLTSDSLNNP